MCNIYNYYIYALYIIYTYIYIHTYIYIYIYVYIYIYNISECYKLLTNSGRKPNIMCNITMYVGGN